MHGMSSLFSGKKRKIFYHPLKFYPTCKALKTQRSPCDVEVHMLKIKEKYGKGLECPENAPASPIQTNRWPLLPFPAAPLTF